MTTTKDIRFWWKPGCATNTRQIRLLEQAGCTVTVHDLLTEAWTPARLAAFLGARAVTEWFNPAAPAVKSGAVVPAAFSPEAALERLIAEPLLIRRPLLETATARCVGFVPEWLAAQGIALAAEAVVAEGCSHGDAPAAHCPPAAASAR